MIDFFKNLLAERVVLKLFSFFFAIGIIPILIFLYGLDNKPKWVNEERHYLESSYAMTIEVPLELFNIQKSRKTLAENAIVIFKKEFYDRALHQVKKSYGWNNLEENLKNKTIKILNELFEKISLTLLKEESIYEDKLNFTLYGLYSIESAEIDILLQEVYEVINKKMMIET